MNNDDRRLIADSLRGHSTSFGELVRRYQDRLYNAIYRVVDHPDDALDVVQEAFISAYQSLNHFKGDSEFFTWLYRIAFNAAISQKRRKRAVLSLDWQSDEKHVTEPADESVDARPGSAMERTEDESMLQRAIQQLPPEYRAVLVLKEIEGRKYEEIADILDVPIGTVRSRLHRARLELRGLLTAHEE